MHVGDADFVEGLSGWLTANVKMADSYRLRMTGLAENFPFSEAFDSNHRFFVS